MTFNERIHGRSPLRWLVLRIRIGYTANFGSGYAGLGNVMINSDQIIYLKIGKKTKIFISILVAVVFALFSLLSVYYVLIKPDPSEDLSLAVISLLPAAVIMLFGWIFILKMKSALSEQDLMEQTAWILGADLPQAIVRRVFGFGKIAHEDFKYLSEAEGKYIENGINLYEADWINKINEQIQIRANIMVGVPSCIYYFSGASIPVNSYASKLEMHIQVNVKRVEVIYKLPIAGSISEDTFESTKYGTEGAGYDVKIVTLNGMLEMQARIEVGSEMLVNSRERLFIVNDIAVMTAHLLRELSSKSVGQ